MRSIYILLFCLVAQLSFGQVTKDSIHWKTASEIQELLQKEKRLVLVDIYTNWCHYCHVMDATTYKNDSLIHYINQYFYCLKLNAETPDDIEWQRKIYHYMPQYKVHELAVMLTKGNIVYPSTAIVSANSGENIKAVGGLQSVNELFTLLNTALGKTSNH